MLLLETAKGANMISCRWAFSFFKDQEIGIQALEIFSALWHQQFLLAALGEDYLRGDSFLAVCLEMLHSQAEQCTRALLCQESHAL